MVLHEFEVKCRSRSTQINIIPVGDIHMGSRFCAKDKFRRMVEWIKNTPHTYWIGLGDYIEAINFSDPRFDPDAIDSKYQFSDLKEMVKNQINDFAVEVDCIKDRCIGLGAGNHEHTIVKKYHQDPVTLLCGKLDVRNLGWASMTRFIMRRAAGSNSANYPSKTLTIFAEHSKQGGRKKGGKINNLEDRTSDFEADIYFRGHSHDKVATTKVTIELPHSGELRMRPHKRVYAICPSFFRTYQKDAVSYGEMASYSPTAMGIIRVEVLPFKDDGVDMHIWQ